MELLPIPNAIVPTAAQDSQPGGAADASPSGGEQPSDDQDIQAPKGRVQLNRDLIRRLRQERLLSQQELADDCWRRNIQLSLTTIKRAELGRLVRFRIAREFARCFCVGIERLLRLNPNRQINQSE